MKLPRRVVCAALRVGDDIICGARHYDSVMVKQIESCKNPEKWLNSEQGFIDQFGVYLTREEAWVVASTENQIIPLMHNWCTGTLYSEHLY